MGKVLYGIKNVYASKLTEDEQGNVSYGTPFKLEGATGFSPAPQGDTATFYADNRIYYKKAVNNGYEGDLTLAVLPETFLTQIQGRRVDSNGAVIENSSDVQSRFALIFEADGDPKARRYVYYDCTANRATREFSTTEDSLSVGTESLTISIAPRSNDGEIGAYMEKTEENASVYNSWFTSVYEGNTSL